MTTFKVAQGEMNFLLQCIKEVIHEPTARSFFKKDFTYKAKETFNAPLNCNVLVGIDELENEHTICTDQNGSWHEDEWFKEHFVIIHEGKGRIINDVAIPIGSFNTNIMYMGIGEEKVIQMN